MLDLADTLLHLERVLADGKTVDASLFAKPSDRDRFIRQVEKLRGLVETKQSSSLTRAQITSALFPGLKPDSISTQFSVFRKYLEKVGSNGALRFRLDQPDTRNRSEGEIVCRFEGDSMADHRNQEAARKFLKSGTSFLHREREYTEMKAKGVNIFVSFAVADTALADEFIRSLKENLPLRCPDVAVKFWRFDEKGGILPGEDNEVEIRRQMDQSRFGLLLISPGYLQRDFIKRVELPHFLGPLRKAHPIPVALKDFEPGRDKHPLLDSANIFALKGKAYKQVPAAKKIEFIKGLCDKIAEQTSKLSFVSPARSADTATCAAIQEAMEIAQGILDHPDDATLKKEAFAKLTNLETGLDFEGREDFTFWLAALREAGKGEVKAATETFIGLLARREDRLAKSAAAEKASPGLVEGVPLVPEILQWFDNPEDCAWLALLAEAGAGKTMTCGQVANIISNRTDSRQAYYLDLKLVNEAGLFKTNRNPLLAEIIAAILARNPSIGLTPASLLEMVRAKGALLIWDGLDEVLVHLSQLEGTAFFNQLKAALPADVVAQKGSGRLLFACRTHHFRNMQHEASSLSSGQRGDANAADTEQAATRAKFRLLRILPFSEDQVRSYLTANLPSMNVDSAMEVIKTVHNLRDLAERPYFLSLMRASLPDLERAQFEGRQVRSVDLYQSFIDSWLERDVGKHRIEQNDKILLMAELAHFMWKEEAKSLPIARIEQWLKETISNNKLFAEAYRAKLRNEEERDQILQDLRTATFLGRWDGEAFRFAHTSLQEFFLASHLVEALEQGNLESWNLPLPSRETFDFACELWAKRREQSSAAARRLDATMAKLLGEATPRRSHAALDFWMRLEAKKIQTLRPAKLDFQGLDFVGWQFLAESSNAKLDLSGADFSGACLLRAVFENVDLSASLFENVDARSAEFQNCNLQGCRWSGKTENFAGILLRHCEGGPEEIPPPAPGRRSINWNSIPTSSQPAMIMSQAVFLTGHSGNVLSCAISHDGTRIVSAGEDSRVRVFNSDSGKVLCSIKDHSGIVWSCALSANGGRIVSGGNDSTVRIFDASSGKCLHALREHSGAILSCALSSDSRRMVSAGQDSKLRVWDAATGELLHTLSGHVSYVWSCALNADGSRVVSCGENSQVRVWDSENGKLLHTLMGHEGRVTSCSMSEDGKFVVTGGHDSQLLLWDAKAGKLLHKLLGHAGGVTSCALSTDGTIIVSGGMDHQVRIWNTKTGKLIHALGGHSGHITSCAVSADRTRIVSSQWQGSMLIWDATSGKLLRSLNRHSELIKSCHLSADGTTIVTGEEFSLSRLWDAKTGKLLTSLAGASGAILRSELSKDGCQLTTVSNDSQVRVWNIPTRTLLKQTRADEATLKAAHAVHEVEGLEIVSRQHLRLTDPKTGQLIREMSASSNGEWAVIEPRREGDPEGCATVIRRASPGAWRWLGYVFKDAEGNYIPDAPVLEAEHFGPIPED